MATYSGYLAIGTLSGATFSEFTGNGYSRVLVSLTPDVGGTIQNDSVIVVPAEVGPDRQRFNALAVYDAITGGNQKFAWRINPAIEVFQADSPSYRIPVEGIQLSFPEVRSNSGSAVVFNAAFYSSPGGLAEPPPAEEQEVTATGSVTPRTLADWTAGLEGTYSVTEFDALGDGETDNKVALEAAVAAVPAGSTLIFPPGVYLLSDRVLISKSLRLVGYGATLKPFGTTVAHAQVALLSFNDIADGVILEGLTFDGGSPSFTEAKTAVQVFDVQGFRSLNCTYQNIRGRAILLSTNCDDSEFTGNRFYNCGCAEGRESVGNLYQALCYGGGRHARCLVKGNFFDTIGLDGIAFQAIDSGLVSDNIGVRLYNGVYVFDGFDISVAGNRFSSAPDTPIGLTLPGHGIDVAQSERVTIVGNTVDSFAGAGIVVGGSCDNVSVVGNISRNNGQDVASPFRFGISLGTIPPNAGSSNITVSANICIDTQETATQLYGIGQYDDTINTVRISEDNVCQGNATGEIAFLDSSEWDEAPLLYTRDVKKKGLYPDFLVGRWYSPIGAVFAATPAASVAGRIYAVYCPLPEETKIDGLALRIVTGVASSHVRLGIYSDIAGRPGLKLAETASLDTSVSSTNANEILSAAEIIGAGGMWLVTHTDGAVAARTITPAGPSTSSYGSVSVGTAANGGVCALVYTETFANGLPADMATIAGTVADVTTAVCPLPVFRIA